MLYEYFINSFEVFLIIMSRLIGMVIIAPFFSSNVISFRFKLSLIFFLSLISVPVVLSYGYKPPTDIINFGTKLLSSFLIGLGIGFFCFVIINTFQLSSHIFSMQMGLGMNEVFDPLSDTQTPAVGNILAMVVLLILFRFDGHIVIIQAIIESFKTSDLITNQVNFVFIKSFLYSLVVLFDTSLKISIPIVGVMLLIDVAMGLISRVAPQFNIMIMGFNIKLILGFIALWVIAPFIVDAGNKLINGMLSTMNEFVLMFNKVK